MESGEHTIIGNSSDLPSIPNNALLVQGVRLTYGHVVALGGDFYGVPNAPICLAANGADRQNRFLSALATLLAPTNVFGPPVAAADLQKVVGLIDAEVAALQPAVRNPSPTGASDVYKSGSGVSNAWATIYTLGTYLALSGSNFDHFGLNAQLAYLAGHRVAITRAILAHNRSPLVPGGPPANLNDAYAANAFADHFLTDLFSAGHLRTPRKELHDWSKVGIPGVGMAGDVLAWYGHDEDCKYGLNVRNKSQTWMMYGDKRIFDSVNITGRDVAAKAVEVSKQEVYQAYASGKDPYSGISLDAPPDQVPCPALQLAPDVNFARDWQSNPDHRILFSFTGADLMERQDVNDLKDYHYVKCSYGPTTWTDLKTRYTL
jgi:hypothetical protein